MIARLAKESESVPAGGCGRACRVLAVCGVLLLVVGLVFGQTVRQGFVEYDDQAFVNENPLYLQSTGFVLAPDGRVVVSVYSSGAIGRLVPEDIVGMVRYVREHAAATS